MPDDKEVKQLMKTATPIVCVAGICALLSGFTGCQLTSTQTAATDPLPAARNYDRPRGDVVERSGVSRASYYEDEPEGIDDETFTIGDLAPENVAGNLSETYKSATGRGRSTDAARKLYASAEKIYEEAAKLEGAARSAKFHEAAETYLAAAGRWPDSALEQDAIYMAAESHFFADELADANHQYEVMIEKYPNSKHLDQAEARRFEIASYWLKLHDKQPDFYTVNAFDEKRPWRDTFGSAVRIFDKIRLDDPTGKLADDATLAAGNAHFRAKNYILADNFYTDLRQTFPASEHQFNAHFLGMQTKILTYDGPKYSADPLDAALELHKRIKKQFPREAQQNREALAKAHATILYKKAEREFAMAQYYENRSQGGGARFHYQQILTKYADTPFAEKARARMPQIAHLPQESSNYFDWITEWLPKSEEEKMAAIEPANKQR